MPVTGRRVSLVYSTPTYVEVDLDRREVVRVHALDEEAELDEDRTVSLCKDLGIGEHAVHRAILIAEDSEWPAWMLGW